MDTKYKSMAILFIICGFMGVFSPELMLYVPHHTVDPIKVVTPPHHRFPLGDRQPSGKPKFSCRRKAGISKKD